MNVVNVAILDIPLEQAFNHVKYLSILLVFLLKHLFLIYQLSSVSLDHVQMVQNLWILRPRGPREWRRRGLRWKRWIRIIAHHF